VNYADHEPLHRILIEAKNTNNTIHIIALRNQQFQIFLDGDFPPELHEDELEYFNRYQPIDEITELFENKKLSILEVPSFV
jgi:hypothetical protein